MANVIVKFNNQNYHLACKEGEGGHLTKLADYVNSKAAEISDRMGAVADSRLLLMTAILIADELNEARDGKMLDDKDSQDKADQMEKILGSTLKRIEDITRQVEAEG